MTTYYDSNLARAGGDKLQNALGLGFLLVDGTIQTPEQNESISEWGLKGSPALDEDSFHTVSQIIEIKGNAESSEAWDAFINSILPAGAVENNFFNFTSADSESSYYTSQIIHNKSFFQYENYSKSLNTLMLPSNALIEDENSLTTFNGVIPPASVNSFSYFENYTENLQSVFDNSSEYISKNANVFVLKDMGENYTSGFPGYLKMRIRNTQIPSNSITDETLDVSRNKFLFQFVKNNPVFPTNFIVEDASQVSVGTYDLLEWLASFDGIVKFTDGDDEVFLSDNLDIESDYVNILHNYMLYSTMKALVKNYTRTPLETLRNDESVVEVLGYKIEKFLDVIAGDPIQTFYINKFDTYFVDSQMKHGQKYVYVITALTAVYGSEVTYELQSTDFVEDEEATAEILMTVTPSLKMFEIPFATTEEIYVEVPPNVPMYSFGNESGKKQIKILLSSNYVNKSEDVEFLNITQADSAFYSNVAVSQKGFEPNTSFMYSSGRYEVFRVSTMPKSYSDFANGFVSVAESTTNLSINTINGFGNGELEQPYSYSNSPKSAEFTDMVAANVKYYYLFRELTEHNNPSNPTEILEVELIEDADETYVVVNPFVFEEQKDYTYKKEMKRFMQIVPNPQQTDINEETLDGVSSAEGYTPVLGPFPEELWNKKFKIRLTSKHTGKKIDVNIQFGKKLKT